MPNLEPILILGDVHRPYHDKRAWGLVLQAGAIVAPAHIWLMGDFLDCYSVSDHSKDPRRERSLVKEIADAKIGLDQLDALGATSKVFLEGNHEDRLRRYLERQAPELFEAIDLPSLLGLEERGWSWLPYKRAKRVGKVHLTHDIGVAGRYAAYRALDAFQHTVLSGHTHRFAYVVEGNAVGEQKLSASFGHLSDLRKVDYMHQVNAMRNWALGFGIGYLDPSSGIVYLTPVPIVKYTCVINGQLLKG